MDEHTYHEISDFQGGYHPEFSFKVLHGFVGGDLQHDRYLSPFGALLKLTRLNQLRRGDIHAAFGFNLIKEEDPASVLAFSAKRLAAFSAAIGINPHARPGWQVGDWLPFEGYDPWKKRPWRARLCLSCAREGYHSWLFQMPWVTCCPWHGTPLVEACPSCWRPFTQSFSRGTPLLQCECGIDFFSRHAALRSHTHDHPGRDRSIGRLLAWAQQCRSTHHLVAPPHQAHMNLALKDLCRPPVHANDTLQQGLHSQTIRNKWLGNPTCISDLRALMTQLEKDRTSLVEVPMAWVAGMQAIAYGLCRRAPPGSFCPAEAKRLVVDGVVVTRNRAAHAEIMYLPVQVSGNHAFLMTNSLPKGPLAVVADLLTYTRNQWNDPITAASALKAAQAIVLRAYADGLRIILGRHIPDLYSHSHRVPGEHMPWVTVSHDMLGVTNITVIWTKEPLDAFPC